jgi:signal transduction histidine kinase
VVVLLKRDPAFRDLDVTIEGDVPHALADANLATISLQNLLINAGQAQQGRGTVRVILDATPGSNRIQIVDEGPGIPAEIRAELYRPFKTTKARGTGLGMATAKRLIESQSGTIAVECPPGGGTVVTLTLPSAPQQPE